MRKESLKKIQAFTGFLIKGSNPVYTSLNFSAGFLFATAKVAHITAVIILHLKTMELVILNHIYFLAI